MPQFFWQQPYRCTEKYIILAVFEGTNTAQVTRTAPSPNPPRSISSLARARWQDLATEASHLENWMSFSAPGTTVTGSKLRVFAEGAVLQYVLGRRVCNTSAPSVTVLWVRISPPNFLLFPLILGRRKELRHLGRTSAAVQQTKMTRMKTRTGVTSGGIIRRPRSSSNLCSLHRMEAAREPHYEVIWIVVIVRRESMMMSSMASRDGES